MQLSKFTDYALRMLMHLAVADGELIATREIADIHDAKYNHLAKVSQWLVREGYVTSSRGRSGGIELGRPASDINIGQLIRKLEDQSELVECLRADGGTCALAPQCRLTNALSVAQEAFFASLDQLSLADITVKNPGMRQLLVALHPS